MKLIHFVALTFMSGVLSAMYFSNRIRFNSNTNNSIRKFPFKVSFPRNDKEQIVIRYDDDDLCGNFTSVIKKNPIFPLTPANVAFLLT